MKEGLNAAILSGDLALIAELYRLGEPPALQSVYPDFSPQFAAIEACEDHGSVLALALLLRLGADPNERHASGDTPLLMAAYRGLPSALALLLSHGADPAVRGPEGDTPLSALVGQGRVDLVEMLLVCGADRTLEERTGFTESTVLEIAASKLDIAMIRSLLRAGARTVALDGRKVVDSLPARKGAVDPAWDAAFGLLTSGM